MVDETDHFPDLCRFFRTRPEIGVHTSVQIDRFSYIYNGVCLIMHDINAGRMGKFFQFLLDAKHDLSPFSVFCPIQYFNHLR